MCANKVLTVRDLWIIQCRLTHRPWRSVPYPCSRTRSHYCWQIHSTPMDFWEGKHRWEKNTFMIHSTTVGQRHNHNTNKTKILVKLNLSPAPPPIYKEVVLWGWGCKNPKIDLAIYHPSFQKSNVTYIITLRNWVLLYLLIRVWRSQVAWLMNHNPEQMAPSKHHSHMARGLYPPSHPMVKTPLKWQPMAWIYNPCPVNEPLHA